MTTLNTRRGAQRYSLSVSFDGAKTGVRVQTCADETRFAHYEVMEHDLQ